MESCGICCIHHRIDEAIYLFRFDSLQIVAHTHVELETIHSAQVKFLCHYA